MHAVTMCEKTFTRDSHDLSLAVCLHDGGTIIRRAQATHAFERLAVVEVVEEVEASPIEVEASSCL